MKRLRITIAIFVSLIAGVLIFLFGCFLFLSFPEIMDRPDAVFSGIDGVMVAVIFAVIAMVWIFMMINDKWLQIGADKPKMKE